jgi:hypothetical protein
VVGLLEGGHEALHEIEIRRMEDERVAVSERARDEHVAAEVAEREHDRLAADARVGDGEADALTGPRGLAEHPCAERPLLGGVDRRGDDARDRVVARDVHRARGAEAHGVFGDACGDAHDEVVGEDGVAREVVLHTHQLGRERERPVVGARDGHVRADEPVDRVPETLRGQIEPAVHAATRLLRAVLRDAQQPSEIDAVGGEGRDADDRLERQAPFERRQHRDARADATPRGERTEQRRLRQERVVLVVFDARDDVGVAHGLEDRVRDELADRDELGGRK